MTQDEFIDAVLAVANSEKTSDKAKTIENVKALAVDALGQEKADALFNVNAFDFLQMFTLGGLVRLVIETKD